MVAAIEAGELLDVLAHPNPERYPGQRILMVRLDDYAHLVPFVETADGLLLKAIIPSRKATRRYLAESAERQTVARGAGKDLGGQTGRPHPPDPDAMLHCPAALVP